MPQYVFLCQDCKKEFTLILHIADLEKGEWFARTAAADA